MQIAYLNSYEKTKKLRAEYLENAAFEAENNLKDIDYEEAFRKAWEQDGSQYLR